MKKLFRKVEIGKLTVSLLGRLVVGTRRFFGRNEIPYVDPLSRTNGNPASPSSRFHVLTDSLKSGFAFHVLASVSSVLGLRAFSKVFLSIVERIAVYVVHEFSSFTSENKAVHPDGVPMPVFCVKALGFIVPIGVPIEGRKPLKILSINYRVLALRKWNETVRLVKRLGDFVSTYTLVFHKSTSNGFVIPAAIISFLIFPTISFAQGSNYSSVILGSTGRPVGSAQITVCAGGSPGIPCTPTVNIYQDQALTIPQSNPIITDSYGNFSFWAAPGTFEYTVTGLNVVAHGPFTVILPCIVGAACASAGGLPNTAVAFSPTPSFSATSNASYSMPLTGNVTAITVTGTPVNGNLLRFQFTQDSIGGRTVIWPANFQIPTTFAFKILPNENNRMTFLYDGTNWQLLNDIPDGALDYSSVTFSATPTFSNSRSAYFDFTMTGNVTSSTFSTTGRAGTQFVLNACQDGVGGRTFAFPGNVSNPQGFIFDTVANHCNRIYYTWNGTQWNGIGGGGGGGGGTPANPTNSLQKNASGSFGSTNVSEVGTDLLIDDNQYAKGANPYFDLMRYGGYFEPSNAPVTTTGSINSASATLSLAAAQNFANGQGIVVQGAGQLPLTRNASFPAAPAVGTVTPLGVINGTTTYNYKYVLEDYFGGLTAAGTQGSTTVGAATLGTNPVSLTGVVRSGGIDTFTCSANCNVGVNSLVQISGFASQLVDGTVVVASTPTAGTFTVNAQGQADYTESASGTMSVRACNAVIPSGTLSQESVILRTWIYRGGTLVGVSPGQDPFFIDCNQGVTAPAYVPTTAPASAQAGYLATTISSGGGTTTLTLANAAGTTVAGATVQHDNSSALIAAWTAAYATHGGVVRIPVISTGGLNTFPFNATTNLTTISNPTASTVKLQISSATMNQPLIPSIFSEMEGIPQTSTSFQYSPLGSISGTAQPLILINHGTTGGVQISKIKFSAFATGASSLVLDQVAGGGGEVGFIFNDNGYSSNNASPIVIKGGFDFWFTHGVCSTGGTENGQWYAHPCMELTNASSYLSGSATQVPGRVKIYDMNFQGSTAIQQDNYPSMNQPGVFVNGQLNMTANGILHEGIVGPTIRIAIGLGTSQAFGGGLDVSDVVTADPANGLHQPIVEMTGTTGFNVMTIKNDRTAGAQSTINGGGSGLAATCINNTSFGCGQTSNSILSGANSINDGGTYGLINGGSLGYLMSTPAAPASCVVSGGGSVPLGQNVYLIAATNQNTVSFAPYNGITVLGPACTVTTTSGNQTVTVTRPTLPFGATGWMVWRGPNTSSISEAQMPVSCATPIPATTTTYVDTFSFTCGTSQPTVTTAEVNGITSAGINAAQFIGNGYTSIIKTITSAYTPTINDHTIRADASSAGFTVSLNPATVGSHWVVSRIDNSGNTLTVAPTSGLIDGAASTTIATLTTKTFYCSNGNCITESSSAGSGSNVIAAPQFSDPIYSGSGTSNTISGLSPPTVNGFYVVGYNVTASAAVTKSQALLGVPINSQTCATYTLLYSDRASRILCSGGTTGTITLPAISGNLASNMPFQTYNGNTGNLTLTATSPNTINGGSAGGSVTQLPGWLNLWGQDNTPNWFTQSIPTFGAFNGSCQAITFNSSTGLPCATLFYQTLGVGGTSQTQRGRLNLIAGTNVTIANVDNSGTGSSDVTISASGGGGGGNSCTNNPAPGAYTPSGTAGAVDCLTAGTYVLPTSVTTLANNNFKIVGVGAASIIQRGSGASGLKFTGNQSGFQNVALDDGAFTSTVRFVEFTGNDNIALDYTVQNPGATSSANETIGITGSASRTHVQRAKYLGTQVNPCIGVNLAGTASGTIDSPFIDDIFVAAFGPSSAQDCVGGRQVSGSTMTNVTLQNINITGTTSGASGVDFVGQAAVQNASFKGWTIHGLKYQQTTVGTASPIKLFGLYNGIADNIVVDLNGHAVSQGACNTGDIYNMSVICTIHGGGNENEMVAVDAQYDRFMAICDQVGGGLSCFAGSSSQNPFSENVISFTCKMSANGNCGTVKGNATGKPADHNKIVDSDIQCNGNASSTGVSFLIANSSTGTGNSIDTTHFHGCSGVGSVDLTIGSGMSNTTIGSGVTFDSGDTLTVSDSGTATQFTTPLAGGGIAGKGQVVITGRTTAITAATVVAPDANSTWRVHVSVACTTSSASATVTPTITYTDVSNTAQTVTGTAATCTTLGAASVTSQDIVFRAKAATNVQYSTAIANTPTYDFSLQIERLTTQ